MSKKINSNNTFKFVGKLDYNKEKFYHVYDSADWEIIKLNFSVICGSNRHFVEVTGFKPKDPKREIVYFTKDKENNFKKVQFSKRDKVDKKTLNYQQPKLDCNGNETRYVTTYDFARALYSLLENNMHSDSMFEVKGQMEYSSYAGENGLKESEKFVVTEISELPMASSPESLGFYKVYLGDNALEKVGNIGVLKGKSVVVEKKNGEEKYYGYDTKIEIGLGENSDAAFELLKKRYSGSNDRLGRIGIMCEIVNGFEDISFTEDMLNDTEREAIALGIDTFEDIKRAKGTGKGEKVKSIRRIKELRGYTDGSEETALSMNDFENNSEIIDFTSESAQNSTLSPDNFSSIDDDDLPF